MKALDSFINSLTSKKAVLFIVLLGSFFYFNSLFNGFVWDDEEQIVNNAIIQNLGNINQIFSGATFSTGGAGLSGWFFRPFLTLSYMLTFTLFHLNAWGYHLVQVILHIVTTIVLFKVLQKLLNKEKETKLTFLNLLLSSIFVVHAALTEAVSYIAASSEIWYSLFDLSAFYLVIKYPSLPKRKLLYFCLFLFCAALFKESSVVFFPILFFYLLIYQSKNLKKISLGLGGTLGIYLITRLIIVRTPFQSPGFAPISEASLPVRLTTIPKELSSYLHIIFYPDRLAISQHFLVTSASSPGFIFPLIIEAILLALILFIGIRYKSRLVIFGLLWFGIGFSLISNIFPLDMTIAERWLYFPFIGFILMSAGVFQIFIKNKKLFYPLILFLIFAIPLLGIRTIIRNSNWHDGLTLYSHDEKISKNSFDLENNLGVELFRAGNYTDAKKHFEESIALQPKWYFTYNNLGAVYEREGNWQKALTLYQKTLTISDYYLAYENIAGIMIQHDTPSNTKRFAEESLKKLPNNSNLWLILSISDYKLGKKDEALQAAINSYQLSPTQQSAYIVNQLQNNQELNLQ